MPNARTRIAQAQQTCHPASHPRYGPRANQPPVATELAA